MEFRVSVVIPTYNRLHLLPFAIQSALDQILPPIEVVVIDDASIDTTSEWMESRYGGDPRVRYLRLAENRGPSVTRVVGVGCTSGEILSFLDSDDIWLPNHLKVAFRAWDEDPDRVAVLTQRGEIDKEGRVLRDIVHEAWSGDVLEVLLKRIILHPSRLVVRRDVWAKVNERIPTTGPSLRFVEDYVAGVTLAHLYGARVAVLSDRTVWMRAHESQSYHNAVQLRENLQAAAASLFAALPDLQRHRPVTEAANLCHAAYFMWRSGDWYAGWTALANAVRRCPRIAKFKDFWIAFSRLLIPPRIRRLCRQA